MPVELSSHQRTFSLPDYAAPDPAAPDPAAPDPAAPDPEVAVPTTEALVALRRFILAAETFRGRQAERFDIAVRDTTAISYLTDRGAMRQHDLAQALGLSAGAVTALVDRLESRGLATRCSTAADRRISLVTLTDTARRHAAETRRSMQHCLDGIDAAAAIAVLEHLTAGLLAI